MVTALISISVISAFIIYRQQRIIERLNDRLMARNYGEYKHSVKEIESPPVEDEPKGWFDH